ncbi:MAG: AAA family ATPase [Verrucomicrobiae bacterium]|nr:AAA family ATPase [Verrucomicrobiae bacterium]
MRFLSATLRNYRMHRELRVAFDPARTLIGGPNESGKSTLIEAMHRALFLKAKGNTQAHRDMQSPVLPEVPAVELEFQMGNERYRLAKRFGPGGVVSLSREGREPKVGEAAEEALAQLLGVETGLKGQAAAVQWGHLWVWQGSASDDPSAIEGHSHIALLRRLRDMGGAGLMQSERDDRVARQFAEAVAGIFTQNGRARAGSELARAEAEVSSCEEAAVLARARWERLEGTAESLAEAQRRLSGIEEMARSLEGETRENDVVLEGIATLRQRQTVQEGLLREAEAARDAVRAVRDRMRTFGEEIQKRTAELAPRRGSIGECETMLAARSAELTRAEARLAAAGEAVRKARQRADLAGAREALQGALSERETLRAAREQAVGWRLKATELQSRLAALPPVEAKRLATLRERELALATATAALEAMAAEVAVVEADATVLAEGRPLAAGERRVFTDEGEIQVGQGVRLRIRPGGGQGLAEARRTVEETRAALQAGLDAMGIPGVVRAAEVVAEREAVEAELGRVLAKLEAAGADGLDARLGEVEGRVRLAEGEILRLGTLLPEGALGTGGGSEGEAAEGVDAAGERRRVTSLEDEEQSAREMRDAALEARREAETRRIRAEEEIKGLDAALQGVRANLDYLRQQHGDDVAVDVALDRAEQGVTAVRGGLEALRSELAERLPELKEEQRRRLREAQERNLRERADLRERMAGLRGQLQEDGGEDPRGAWSLAEARLRSARERRAGLARQGEAFRLLERLFGEERGVLADRFTRPFQERVGRYLECVFGRETALHLAFTGEALGALRLSRAGWNAFAFDQLSGGAREQAGVAVRLAMAEVLASDFGGCLPVVLDDAFAYSDPERVRRLQDMLFRASEGGLQVIVVTCTPGDYAGFGGRTVMLGAG